MSDLVKQCCTSLRVDGVYLRSQDEIKCLIKVLFIYTVFCLDFDLLQLPHSTPYQAGWALWFTV